jgi:hypothetical protein
MPALLQKVGEFAISNYLEFERVMPQEKMVMKQWLLMIGVLILLQGCCVAEMVGKCCASAVGAAVVTGCFVADAIL